MTAPTTRTDDEWQDMAGEWQALTALAEYAQHDGMCGTSQAYGPITCDCGLDAARAALEAVRGD